mmetsp:Transcript_4251/g.13607  ORF Transcript_4251/g.13607 Transcript_4251/m.13607 type:complete len:317 (+) Transcript_4251:845-1795(+)
MGRLLAGGHGAPDRAPPRLVAGRPHERALRLHPAQHVDDQRRLPRLPLLLAVGPRGGAARPHRGGPGLHGHAAGEPEQGLRLAPGQPKRAHRLPGRHPLVGGDGQLRAGRLRGTGVPSRLAPERDGEQGRGLREPQGRRPLRLPAEDPLQPRAGGPDHLGRPHHPPDRGAARPAVGRGHPAPRLWRHPGKGWRHLPRQGGRQRHQRPCGARPARGRAARRTVLPADLPLAVGGGGRGPRARRDRGPLAEEDCGPGREAGLERRQVRLLHQGGRQEGLSPSSRPRSRTPGCSARSTPGSSTKRHGACGRPLERACSS